MNNFQSYDYIASPYTHPEASIRQDRYNQVMAYCAFLMKKRIHCFSPIVHCHPMAVVWSMPKEFEFWKSYDETMIRRANAVRVLALPGWSNSVGIKHEVEFARSLGLHVLLIKPAQYNYEAGFYPVVGTAVEE